MGIMQTKSHRLMKCILGSIICSIFVGCLLSGTYVVVEKFDFPRQSRFYWKQIDVTDNPIWIEHKNGIDCIDAVGFEFFLNSSFDSTINLNVYVLDYSGPGWPIMIPEEAFCVINNLKIVNGITHISYLESLKLISHLDELKAVSQKGKFQLFADITYNSSTEFTIDSAKIVLTITAK